MYLSDYNTAESTSHGFLRRKLLPQLLQRRNLKRMLERHCQLLRMQKNKTLKEMNTLLEISKEILCANIAQIGGKMVSFVTVSTTCHLEDIRTFSVRDHLAVRTDLEMTISATTEFLVIVGLVWISLNRIGEGTMTVSITFHMNEIMNSLSLIIRHGLTVCQFINLVLSILSIIANLRSIEVLNFHSQTDLVHWETFRGGHSFPPGRCKHNSTV